ncbi:MAG: elongation factor P [Clostridia bacterium]|nr:elongation factor P [Clostridia bacterium]
MSTNDFHAGLNIEVDGQLFQVVESMHVKPGKGQAFVRTKLRNLVTGAVLDRTFGAGEKVAVAHVERHPAQYLYAAEGDYYFMDLNTFDQVRLTADQLGQRTQFLKEGMDVDLVFHEGSLLDVELPTTVDLEVVETEPGVRGDTAAGGSKPARLETGAVVRVPLFVERGDVIRVDTRTGAYVSRA